MCAGLKKLDSGYPNLIDGSGVLGTCAAGIDEAVAVVQSISIRVFPSKCYAQAASLVQAPEMRQTASNAHLHITFRLRAYGIGKVLYQ